MLEFSCFNRKPDGTPIVCDAEIMAYAENQIWDYDPELLKVPQKLDALQFVENYLNTTVEVQDIKYTMSGREVSGITVLKEADVSVCEDGEIIEKRFPAGTIIIDETIMGRGDGYELFTICHEAGHFCIHFPAFYGSDILAARSTMDKIMCRSNMIGSERTGNKRWTDRDFMEHHANIYAAALLMPRPSFVPFVQESQQKSRI